MAPTFGTTVAVSFGELYDCHYIVASHIDYHFCYLGLTLLWGAFMTDNVWGGGGGVADNV